MKIPPKFDTVYSDPVSGENKKTLAFLSKGL